MTAPKAKRFFGLTVPGCTSWSDCVSQDPLELLRPVLRERGLSEASLGRLLDLTRKRGRDSRFAAGSELPLGAAALPWGSAEPAGLETGVGASASVSLVSKETCIHDSES